MNYIRHESPRQDAEKRPDLEFAFGYFYIRYVLEEETAPLNPFYNELMTELYSIKDHITKFYHKEKSRYIASCSTEVI